MDRRSAIKYTTALTGITLSSAFISGFLSSCKPEIIDDTFKPLFLSSPHFTFLESLVDVLIPETDTPGALSLGVPEWIDAIVAKCYADKDQQSFKTHFEMVYQVLNTEKSFEKQEVESKAEKIKALEASLNNQNELKAAYQQIKGMAATAYLGTEYVGINLLNYLPVPGEYEACIPLSATNGKSWTYE